MELISSLEVCLRLGLLFSVLAMGYYVSYSILDFPDLTVEGTFLTGGVVFALFVHHGFGQRCQRFGKPLRTLEGTQKHAGNRQDLTRFIDQAGFQVGAAYVDSDIIHTYTPPLAAISSIRRVSSAAAL